MATLEDLLTVPPFIVYRGPSPANSIGNPGVLTFGHTLRSPFPSAASLPLPYLLTYLFHRLPSRPVGLFSRVRFDRSRGSVGGGGQDRGGTRLNSESQTLFKGILKKTTENLSWLKGLASNLLTRDWSRDSYPPIIKAVEVRSQRGRRLPLLTCSSTAPEKENPFSRPTPETVLYPSRPRRRGWGQWGPWTTVGIGPGAPDRSLGPSLSATRRGGGRLGVTSRLPWVTNRAPVGGPSGGKGIRSSGSMKTQGRSQNTKSS